MTKTLISLTLEPEVLRTIDRLKSNQGRGQFIGHLVQRFADGSKNDYIGDAEKIRKLTRLLANRCEECEYWRQKALNFKGVLWERDRKNMELASK